MRVNQFLEFVDGDIEVFNMCLDGGSVDMLGVEGGDGFESGLLLSFCEECC
jgi:hypothetical protein